MLQVLMAFEVRQWDEILVVQAPYIQVSSVLSSLGLGFVSSVFFVLCLAMTGCLGMMMKFDFLEASGRHILDEPGRKQLQL